jgi:basic membrane protein A and related proteins
MPTMVNRIWRALRLLLLSVVILSLFSPQIVLGRQRSFSAPRPDISSELDMAQTIHLPIVVKLRFYPDTKACLVTDTGGVNDGGFNAGAWKGVQDSVNWWHMGGAYLESQQQSDFANHINTFIADDCDIIITVGFTMSNATVAAAVANPTQKFSIVDIAFDPTIPNVLGQVFAIHQAAFLAGYTAAGVTTTGKVGTFGGMQIAPVTAYMDGFALGVAYYNQQHSTNVEVLGWNPATQIGLFTGNFDSFTDGYVIGDVLIDEGVDIIMPVAGACGLGAAAVASEHANVYIIGVDTDWYFSVPDYKAITLTSAWKNMDRTTFLAIQSALDGSFAGGVVTGTLGNGGVGLAPFHDLAGLVSPALLAELEAVKTGIINGTIITTPGGG